MAKDVAADRWVVIFDWNTIPGLFKVDVYDSRAELVAGTPTRSSQPDPPPRSFVQLDNLTSGTQIAMINGSVLWVYYSNGQLHVSRVVVAPSINTNSAILLSVALNAQTSSHTAASPPNYFWYQETTLARLLQPRRLVGNLVNNPVLPYQSLRSTIGTSRFAVAPPDYVWISDGTNIVLRDAYQTCLLYTSPSPRD